MVWADLHAHLAYLSDADRRRLERAFEMGKQAHDGQKRKSGEPYFTHPIAMAERLAGMGADADTLIAALLHDTVEDTPLTLNEIEAAFGPAVRGLIDGVTKLTRADLTSPSHDEQIETLRKMFRLMQQDVRIMVIKIVDRWHNMTTVTGLPTERRQSFAQETLDIIVKIADRLSMKELREELTAQSLAVLEPTLFLTLQTMRREFEAQAGDVVVGMARTLKSSLPKGVRTYTKPLSWEKTRIIHELGSGSGKAEVTAIFACPDVQACYTVLGLIHQTWHLQKLTFDDYINAPAMNGYRGIHTTIILPNGTRVRCKVRTETMDVYDRLGVAMYCFRKHKEGEEVAMLPWTERISPLAEGTSYQSQAFWTSLQRDLLGEEIVVYGASEQSVTIPRGATVLDAAFYLFNEQAIRAGAIRLNGQEVALDATLANGDVVDVTFHDEVQAGREWLNYVESGLASALIRQELAKAPETEKILLGRTLLDVGLRRHNLPGLAELKPRVFDDTLAALGLNRPEDLLIQLAEGKLTVPQALNLLSHTLGAAATKPETWELRMHLTGEHESERWVTWLRSLHPNRLHLGRNRGHETVRAQLALTAGQADSIDAYLRPRLPSARWKLQSKRLRTKVLAAAIALVVLWGLDPVVGQLLINQYTSVPGLTIVRFVMFIVVALVAQANVQRANLGRLMPISPLSPTLLASGMALFATTVGTYSALRSIDPTGYILMIVAGVLAVASARALIRREPATATLASLGVVGSCIAAYIAVVQPSPFSIFAALLGSGGFAVYSLASQQYQKTVSIRTRYPTFLLWVAITALVCSLFLLPWTPLRGLTGPGLWLSAAFVLVFTVLPYILYFEIMRLTESRLLDRLLPLVIVSTVAGDLVTNWIWWPLLALPGLMTVCWLLWLHTDDSQPSGPTQYAHGRQPVSVDD